MSYLYKKIGKVAEDEEKLFSLIRLIWFLFVNKNPFYKYQYEYTNRKNQALTNLTSRISKRLEDKEVSVKCFPESDRRRLTTPTLIISPPQEDATGKILSPLSMVFNGNG